MSWKFDMLDRLTRRSAPTEADLQRAAAEFCFGQTVWKGCTNEPCMPGCLLKIGEWRCERFERAFEAWWTDQLR